MRAHSQRLSGVVLSTAALFLGACQEDVGSLGNAHTGGERDASVPPGGMGCTLSHGFWKNHVDEWPVTSLTLGGRTYDQSALLALLHSPSHGDASLILAKQLIAAKLNVAAGASSIGAIAEGDAWIDAHDDSHALPFGIQPSTPAGNEAVQIAADLARYNQGQTGPGHCPDDHPPQPCGPGLTNCGGVCVDTSSDESHCGVCDSVCFPGKMCVDGACVLPGSDGGAGVDAGMDAGPPGVDAGPPPVDAGVDAGPPPVDAGMDAGPPPVDAGMDAGPPPVDAGMDAGPPPVDAGMDAGPPDAGHDAGPPPACGGGLPACGPHSICSSNVCLCQRPYLDCDGQASNGCESHSFSDAENCSACGNVCAQGLFCVDGSCQSECLYPFLGCGRVCEFVVYDTSNCGSCGNVCPSGWSCFDGQCVDCPLGFLDCDGLPENDCEADAALRDNCGGCGIACGLGSYCETLDPFVPECWQCPEGTADCDGIAFFPPVCEVSIATDESNCGACGHACAVGQTCVNGNCV